MRAWRIGKPSDARCWRIRWTAAVVAIVLLMFVSGMAAAGLTHQVGWVLTSKTSFVTSDYGSAARGRNPSIT